MLTLFAHLVLVSELEVAGLVPPSPVSPLTLDCRVTLTASSLPPSLATPPGPAPVPGAG